MSQWLKEFYNNLWFIFLDMDLKTLIIFNSSFKVHQCSSIVCDFVLHVDSYHSNDVLLNMSRSFFSLGNSIFVWPQSSKGFNEGDLKTHYKEHGQLSLVLRHYNVGISYSNLLHQVYLVVATTHNPCSDLYIHNRKLTQELALSEK